MSKIKTFLNNKFYLLKKAERIVRAVEKLKDQMRNLSGHELKAKTQEYINRLQQIETLDDIMPEALALAREASYRAYGMFAFPVQLIGAVIILSGDFAEMKTGEGKTLTIALASYVASLEKKTVHIVTVNEYLVKRDAEFCRKILNFLGITVGFNTSKLKHHEKQKMFGCDVVYTTNSELGFDYLRDQMINHYSQKVIPDLYYAIIDEGDSILIDEAKTPLIISGRPTEDISSYVNVDFFVKDLVNEDYEIDYESKIVSLRPNGISKAEEHFKLNNLYSFTNSDLIHKINNSLHANYLFENGKEYIVKNNEIFLVDHFTGRILEGRSYNAGLHQAIQAKEYIKLEAENLVIATITYQSLFRMYNKLSALSGTALTESKEIFDTYNMMVVDVPTNMPLIRIDYPDIIFGSKNDKWQKVINEIKKHYLIGQPILVGTSVVSDSEIIFQLLKKENIPCEILNARNFSREAEIIAKAGEKYSITISTNMAGRGTDIKINNEVVKLGGLYVIGTDRNDSRRIDNQLRGRAGRQGDPGKSQFFISLEDNIFHQFSSERIEKINKNTISGQNLNNKILSKHLNNVQKRIESINFDMRKDLIKYNQVLSYQQELIYKQRNKILQNDNLLELLLKMNDSIADKILINYLNINNLNHIDSAKLSKQLNNDIFAYPLFLKDSFFQHTYQETKTKLIKVLKKMIALKFVDINPKEANSQISSVILNNLDYSWQRHLNFMTKLRNNVSLRSIEQKSPLNIYIEEGDKAYKELLVEIAFNTIIAFLQFSSEHSEEKCYEYLLQLK